MLRRKAHYAGQYAASRTKEAENSSMNWQSQFEKVILVETPLSYKYFLLFSQIPGFGPTSGKLHAIEPNNHPCATSEYY